MALASRGHGTQTGPFKSEMPILELPCVLKSISANESDMRFPRHKGECTERKDALPDCFLIFGVSCVPHVKLASSCSANHPGRTKRVQMA